MRSMFHATSSAVNSRPFHGGLLWSLMPGLILKTRLRPLGSATSQEVAMCGTTAPVCGFISSSRSVMKCQTLPPSAVCGSYCVGTDVAATRQVPPYFGFPSTFGATIGRPPPRVAPAIVVAAGPALLPAVSLPVPPPHPSSAAPASPRAPTPIPSSMLRRVTRSTCGLLMNNAPLLLRETALLAPAGMQRPLPPVAEADAWPRAMHTVLLCTIVILVVGHRRRQNRRQFESGERAM